MGFTAGFVRQHDEILALADQIAENLHEEYLIDNHKETHDLLNKLAGKLGAHLSMEDKVLYPKLLQDEDREVKKVALGFINEMGSLNRIFGEYVDRWQDPQKIRKQPENFINETSEIFGALGTRVAKENNILYPLADK